MKRGLRRCHCLTRVGLSLVAAALIAGMIGCTFDLDHDDPDPVAPARYDLTLVSTAGGSVTSPGEDTFTYDAGTSVNLVATPADGYRFINWTGNVGTVANRNAASTTITMNGNYSLTANFEEIADYELTISSGAGGSVTSPGEATFSYEPGTVVDLVATPDSGYRFLNWTGNVGTIDDRESASTTITMNGDYSITANFEADVTPEYDLTITSNTGGSVTVTVDGDETVVGPGQTETISDIAANTGVDLVASPGAGYEFANWTGAPVDGVTNAATSFTMQGNYSITASFAAEGEYVLTIFSTGGGSVTIPGEGIFPRTVGTVVDLVAPPDSGYEFVNWTGDTDSILDDNAASTSITIEGHHFITANFVEAEPEYGLTITSGAGGSVTVTIDAQQTTVGAGQTKTVSGIGANTGVGLVASPGAGYEFANWIGAPVDGVTDAATSFAMQGNYSITASFSIEGEVKFPDAALEAAIRKATGVPTGPIFETDLEGLTSLSATYKGIADLTGLEYCINLTSLDLRNNRITSTSPLAGLTGLTYLTLDYNEISSVSHLANLTNLRWLYLSRNQITSVGPLANLTDLRYLYIHSNQISDISPLAGLTSLTRLILYSNAISDISPVVNLTRLAWLYLNDNDITAISHLAGLTRLIRLDLSDNSIIDIEPLVHNDGLGVGDTVWLSGNPLSPTSRDVHIPALVARGVTVFHDNS